MPQLDLGRSRVPLFIASSRARTHKKQRDEAKGHASKLRALTMITPLGQKVAAPGSQAGPQMELGKTDELQRQDSKTSPEGPIRVPLWN